MAGRIPDEFISDLIARADIVSIIERHIPLQKAGKRFKACCPFHEERTPSFFVNPERQIFHCFGCGKSGTAISFLMEYSNLHFRDAIEELAQAVGVEVPVQISGAKQEGDFQKMLELMAEVQTAYRNCLMRSKRGEAARNYLKSRNISSEIAAKFGLGFAPDSWDFVLSRFGKTEHSRRLLTKTGMVIKNENGKTYDRFRNRLMFPIMDRRERVIGFGGRVLDSSQPKYLNSPETPLFDKGREAFGLNHATSAARNAGKILIVEGYTDVLALTQYGINYSVATLGTATTPEQVRKLFQTASHLIFCFDGDTAGRNAAWRALQASLPLMVDGKMASFMFLPQGHDPDSMVREEGAAGFEDRLSSALPISDYVFNVLLAKSDVKRLDGRAKFLEEFKPIYLKLPDSALRALMVQEVAGHTKLDVNYLYSRLEPEQHSRKNAPQRVVPEGPMSINLATKALAVLVQNPKFVSKIDHPDVFAGSTNPMTKLLGEIALSMEDDSNPTTAGLVERYRDSDHSQSISELINLNHGIDQDNLENEFSGIIFTIRKRLNNKETLEKVNSSSLKDDQKFLQLVNDLAESKVSHTR